MRSFWMLIAIPAATLTYADIAYPPTSLGENLHNLAGTWFFRIDPDEKGERGAPGVSWASPDHDDSDWGVLRVPGSWEAQTGAKRDAGNHADEQPLAAYDGVAWYRARFIVPADWQGKDLELYLGSVDDEDRTFLNSVLVGETGPGIARAVLVLRRYAVPASLVKFGRENILAVRVKDFGGPGGIMGPSPYLLPKDKVETMAKLAQSNRPLAERFTAPPAESRILKIIHGLPDAPEQQDLLLRALVAQGFGGVVTNVSFDEYLESEPKWQAFVRGVTEAKKAGMSLWLYDERGYPSGSAGGLTLRSHPEWEARGLYMAEATANGGRVALDAPPGVLVRAAAFPLAGDRIDLDGGVDLAPFVRAGQLAWDAPSGAWRVLIMTEDRLYEGTHAALSLADKLPYINLLMPEPTARFIEVTHGRYAAHLGDDLGRWFVATFTDEPSLMSMFMRTQPWRPLPWSPNLPVEFRKRRGYALEPWIPALVEDAGPRTASVRYDFWLTVGELVSENFFGQIQEWCRKHHVLSGGHLLLEEPLVTHVPLYGDFFRCARRLDAPSIDCLTSIPSEAPWFIARLISSAADLEGRGVTMCETSDHSQRYRPAGDTRPVREVSEDEIRGTCNRLIVNGITTITSYYVFSGLSDDELVRLNEWIGRCCTMLQGGHQVTDTALLYPIESIWPRFTPARNWVADCPASARQIEQTYRAAAENLFRSRRDFTYIDARTLAEAEVKDGVLEYKDLRWRVILLPCADTLPARAWENLAQFWRTGGVVIALTVLPANSEKEFPSPHVQDLAREIFKDAHATRFTTNAKGGVGAFLPPGSEALLPFVLDAVIDPDVQIVDRDAPVRVTHRRIDGHEVFFLMNDGPAAWEGPVSLSATGPGEQWDPATGQMTPLGSAETVSVRLGPYGGMLFRFKVPRPPRRTPVAGGVLPGLTLTALPETPPEAAKGEFVQAEMIPDAEHTRPEQPAWRVTGRLTKGNVDTWLFATYTYPGALNLRGAAWLAFDAWIPEGRHGASSLLVILRDKDESEYCADTGVGLDSPGHVECLVPLSQFQPAGWSKNPRGTFDFSAVTCLRIGWGGYYGAEGEQRVFSLSAPRMARINP